MQKMEKKNHYKVKFLMKKEKKKEQDKNSTIFGVPQHLSSLIV